MQSYKPDITTAEVELLLKKYSSSVSTDSSKPIASAVDIESLVASLEEKPEVIETPEVVLEEVEAEVVIEPIENITSEDDAILRSDISWTSDADILAAKKLLTESEYPLPSDSSIQPIQLDIGDQNIEINSLTNQLSEIEIIEP